MSKIFFVCASAAALFIAAPAAQAGTGCNGVVNILVWGCAPWDNNNGAKFPYYRKHKMAIGPQAKAVVKNGVPMVVYNGQTYPSASPIVAQGGGNIVAQGGGNIVAQGGGNIEVWVGN